MSFNSSSTSASRTSSARTSASRGFTVVEVLIVVVLLGITAALAIPMVGNRSDLKVSAATRKVIADFQYAQNLAIATRQNLYIKIDTDTYTICTLSGTTLIAITHPINKSAFGVQFGDTSPSESALLGVHLTRVGVTGASVIGYDTLGAPFNYNEISQTRTGMTATTTLRVSSGNQQQDVVIQPYTGEITIPS
jgi:prepilin-type N-terminal cleavage/methylation domain-containing protein